MRLLTREMRRVNGIWGWQMYLMLRDCRETLLVTQRMVRESLCCLISDDRLSWTAAKMDGFSILASEYYYAVAGSREAASLL